MSDSQTSVGIFAIRPIMVEAFVGGKLAGCSHFLYLECLGQYLELDALRKNERLWITLTLLVVARTRPIVAQTPVPLLVE